MKLSRFGLAVAFALSATVSTFGTPPAVFAQEKPQASVDKPARTTGYPTSIFGEIRAIDEVAQTIKIAFRPVTKVVQIKYGDKTADVLERGQEVIKVVNFTPATRISKVETNLSTAEMKVGDIITEFSVKNYGMIFDIETAPTVASVNPLTFNIKSEDIGIIVFAAIIDTFGLTFNADGTPPAKFDAVTVTKRDKSFLVTVTKPEKTKFDRSTHFNLSDLAIGQRIAVYTLEQLSDKTNERIEATRIKMYGN